MGQPDGCCVFAGHVITGLPTLTIRGKLRDELFKEEQRQKKNTANSVDFNSNCNLGCFEKDHYHVSLLVSFLDSDPQHKCSLEVVGCNDYIDKLHGKKMEKSF